MDDSGEVITTLHGPMSLDTFNAVLAALAVEWPGFRLVADEDQPHVVHVTA